MLEKGSTAHHHPPRDLHFRDPTTGNIATTPAANLEILRAHCHKVYNRDNAPVDFSVLDDIPNAPLLMHWVRVLLLLKYKNISLNSPTISLPVSPVFQQRPSKHCPLMAFSTYTHSSKITGTVIVTMRNGKLHSSEFSIRKVITRNPLIIEVLYSKMHLPTS
jgi:hypothetical protein